MLTDFSDPPTATERPSPSALRIALATLLGIGLVASLSYATQPAVGADPKPREHVSDDAVASAGGIVDLWQNNGARVRTAVFKWKEVTESSPPQLAEGEKLSWPHRRLQFSQVTFVLDGSRWAYRVRTVDGNGAPIIEGERITLGDGDSAMTFIPANPECPYPVGLDMSHGEEGGGSVTSLKPMWWNFRPLIPDGFSFPLSSLTLASETSLINGRQCRRLEVEQSGGRSRQIWVCPSEDFSIVRQTAASEGQKSWQYDIAYVQDAQQQRWVPHQWEFTLSDEHGNAEQTVKSTVESFSINGSIEEGLFQFEFPPGTWVHQKDGTQAIVLTNGRRSVIPKSHIHLPYKTLLENAEKDGAGK